MLAPLYTMQRSDPYQCPIKIQETTRISGGSIKVSCNLLFQDSNRQNALFIVDIRVGGRETGETMRYVSRIAALPTSTLYKASISDLQVLMHGAKERTCSKLATRGRSWFDQPFAEGQDWRQ